MLKLLLRSFLALLLSAASVAHAADDFLEPEKAFKLAVRALNPTMLEVSYEIAPGYYMYREQFKFEAQGATIGTLDYPKGKSSSRDLPEGS